MIKEVLTKDISKFYQIGKKSFDSKLVLNGELFEMYKITPINIMTGDKNTKKQIYEAYRAVLRNCSCDLKIYITKKPEVFNSEIEFYKNKLEETREKGLKLAISKYVEYLEGIVKCNDVYKTTYYLIVKTNDCGKSTELLFSELKQYGLDMEKIKSEEELKEIFKEAMK